MAGEGLGSVSDQSCLPCHGCPFHPLHRAKRMEEGIRDMVHDGMGELREEGGREKEGGREGEREEREIE